ncbi:putative amidase-like protein [Herbihabitans rhizosphaerae]|uniref:Putative amidase-like protein n=1 Tax=Herbihabitans rhizosphaerae TaxID=1872711 RepID=A0A4Q7KXV0_9PSEU|nr:amidase domain-containing protein [Herbihabitans rhizosphaerae]RZS40831.1 putative amidase-like protein [Herbihabitans rhizosphaerae]
MVTYQQLRDVKPDKFADAADDWLKLAKEAEAASEALYERGGKELAKNWEDALGEKARAHCRKIGQDFQAAGMTVRGVVTTLDGLADALEMARQNLVSAVDFATKAGLKVDGDGKVAVPPDARDPRAAEQAKRAGWLIWDAVNDATKIDNEAAASLRRLIQPAGITKTLTQQELADQTLNEPVKRSAHSVVKMIKQTMPLNADPATQAAWWNSLTPAQQNEYMRAAPVELHDMKGTPQDVRQRLIGNDGLNRIEMIRWAEKNGTKSTGDVPGMDNCTNFVSHVLREGGGMRENDNWNEDYQRWLPDGMGIDKEANQQLHTPSWGAASNQHDFLIKNGGQTVPVSQARPGDIVYLEDQKVPRPESIHHSSVVTAVTPDGGLMVTQHNANHANINLDDRLPTTEIRDGTNDKVIVVRPKGWS